MPTTDILKTLGLRHNPFTDRTAEKTDIDPLWVKGGGGGSATQRVAAACCWVLPALGARACCARGPPGACQCGWSWTKLVGIGGLLSIAGDSQEAGGQRARRRPHTQPPTSPHPTSRSSLYLHSDLRGFKPSETTYIFFGRRGSGKTTIRLQV